MAHRTNILLAMSFATDAELDGTIPEDDQFLGAVVNEYCGCEIGRNEDTVFAEFGDAKSVVTCAMAIQSLLAANDESATGGNQIRCRAGVNHRPPGAAERPPDRDEIDDAYKLLAVADLRGISISRTVFDEVHRILNVDYDTSRPIEQCGYLCQNIRQNLGRLDLLQAFAVRIPPSAITNALNNWG